MKESIADKVVESLNDTILEEIEHYMFMSGKYEETNRLYMSDQREIFKIVAKKLIKK